MVVQCCVCKRVRHDNTWMHATDPRAVAKTASHGYCPACLAKAYAEAHAAARPAAAISAA